MGSNINFIVVSDVWVSRSCNLFANTNLVMTLGDRVAVIKGL